MRRSVAAKDLASLAIAAPIAPHRTAAARRRLVALSARRGAAGAQYLVVRDGVSWLELGHGQADVASGQPVTPATTFNAYSITKPFTAAAVLALAEAGRLDLDAPVGVAAGVEGLDAYGTVRETLLHRAGFRNPIPLRWIHPADEHAGFDETAFVQARIAALRGTRRQWRRSAYSNLGYLVLGRAIERASADCFVPAMQVLVLDPLRPGPDERVGFAITDCAGHATGHLRRHGALDLILGLLVDRAALVQGTTDDWVQLRQHQVDGSAYGGLVANARGLARFGSAVIGRAPGLAADVRRGLLEVVPGPGPGRSLGFFAGRLGRRHFLAHAGGGLGAYGELRLYPDIGAVSVLLTNGPGLADAQALDSLDETWLDADGA